MFSITVGVGVKLADRWKHYYLDFDLMSYEALVYMAETSSIAYYRVV